LNAKKLGGKCLHVPQCGYGPEHDTARYWNANDGLGTV